MSGDGKEIIVFDSEQILPCYIVKYSNHVGMIGPKTFYNKDGDVGVPKASAFSFGGGGYEDRYDYDDYDEDEDEYNSDEGDEHYYY